MFFKLDKKQIIAESNKIKQELHYSKIGSNKKKFIKKFIKNHKGRINFFALLVVIETLVGLSLPIISKFYLKNSFDLMDYRTFFITVSVLLGLTVIFLVNSYFRIYTGEKITMTFINNVREAWFTKFFSNTVSSNNSGKRLITKFLYHVQLLKLGVTVIVNEGLQTILLYAGILIYSFIFNDKLFFVLFLSAPLIIVVFLITYFIGKYYIAREQTFNTRIVLLLAESMVNFDLYKLQNREIEKLKEMENLIEIDTHFRIRRQLWIKYSNRLLYGIVLLIGIGLYVVQTFWPFFEFDSVTSIASTGIILGFFSRVIFSTARIGIFFEAFKMGIKIAVPDFSYKKENLMSENIEWNDLVIKSKKTKISYYGDYIKNVKIPLIKGEKVLFYSSEPLGKTTLAQIITGYKCSDSFMFHVDKARTPSGKWCKNIINNYYISPEIAYDTTIGEILFGKNNLTISADEIGNSYSILKKHTVFNFLFDHKDTLGRPANPKKLSNTQKVLLNVAHCLVNDKQLIAVDHTCLDSINDQILQGLEVLVSQKPNTTILFFSSKQNNLFDYAKTYAIRKNNITEV